MTYKIIIQITIWCKYLVHIVFNWLRKGVKQILYNCIYNDASKISNLFLKMYNFLIEHGVINCIINVNYIILIILT